MRLTALCLIVKCIFNFQLSIFHYSKQLHLSCYLVQNISFTFTMIRIENLCFLLCFLFFFGRGRFREAGRFQFVDRFYRISSDTFAFCLKTFDGNKFIGIYHHRISETVMTTKDNFQTWIIFISQQNQLIGFVFSQVILLTGGAFKTETFQIWIVLLISVV